MANVQPAHPENDVLGDICGVIGDALEVPRGQHKLHAWTDETRLLGHVLQQALEDAVAILIDDVIAFQAPASPYPRCERSTHPGSCSPSRAQRKPWAQARRELGRREARAVK